MHFNLNVLGLVASLFLAACGGGGGGGETPISTAPPLVAVTESNAKPLAASAIDAVQNTSAAQGGTGIILGVQLQADASRRTDKFLVMAAAARRAAASVPAPPLSTGVAIDVTEPCELGGSITMTGNVSSQSALTAGDSIGLMANGCVENVNGVVTTLSGRMSITFVSGSITTVPFHVVIDVRATDLSIASGGTTEVASGDARLDWSTASSTSQTLTATGSSMSNRITTGSAIRTTTLKNYTQGVAVNGAAVTSSLSAGVETSSTALGPNGGSYTVSTPLAMAWNSDTQVVTAGVVKVTGAAGSQLLVTAGSNNAVTLQVDANGDGTFEKSVSSTFAELKALL